MISREYLPAEFKKVESWNVGCPSSPLPVRAPTISSAVGTKIGCEPGRNWTRFAAARHNHALAMKNTRANEHPTAAHNF
jgi:hypothetical protein